MLRSSCHGGGSGTRVPAGEKRHLLLGWLERHAGQTGRRDRGWGCRDRWGARMRGHGRRVEVKRGAAGAPRMRHGLGQATEWAGMMRSGRVGVGGMWYLAAGEGLIAQQVGERDRGLHTVMLAAAGAAVTLRRRPFGHWRQGRRPASLWESVRWRPSVWRGGWWWWWWRPPRSGSHWSIGIDPATPRARDAREI